MSNKPCKKLFFDGPTATFIQLIQGLPWPGFSSTNIVDSARELTDFPGIPVCPTGMCLKATWACSAPARETLRPWGGVHGDDWFKAALGLGRIPSKETLRQRFDRMAMSFGPAVQEASIEMLEMVQAPVPPLSTGHVPLDIDVFPMDNSNTKKEGVSRTYKGVDGWPITFSGSWANGGYWATNRRCGNCDCVLGATVRHMRRS